MKAGVVHAKNDIRYEETEDPIIKDNEILVKVKYTGICGSDVPRVNGDACHFYPNILGHEFSGTGVQSNSKNFEAGDRVAGIPLLPCMECSDCKAGDYALCKNYKFIGSSVFGSFAEYVAIPETNAVKFSDKVTFEQGAFFEPATVAIHGLNRLDSVKGKNVAILGGGTIGLFTMQWANIFGAKSVTVFDIVDERLDLAKRLGATYAVNTQSEEFSKYKDFDRVYETAGNTITMKIAFDIAGNKSQLCFIGTPTKELSFSVAEWENMNRKEFILTGSWMSYSAPFPGEEWQLVPKYFDNGQLKIDDSFIHERIPLSEIDKAFEMFKTPGTVKGKILIDSEK